MAEPEPGTRRRRARRLRPWLAALSLVLALAAAEGVLRAAPHALPSWWVREYPWWGVEFFRPGVLAATPLDGVPVPCPWRTHEGHPPSDLAYLFGMFERATNPDVADGPLIRQPIDANGFPNERVLARADIVLLGDSFAFAAGVGRPPGLVVELSRRTGRSVYDVSCPGIAPQQEAWLLEHYALPTRPRVVVWVFFAGNDILDAGALEDQRQRGAASLADLPGYRPLPSSWLLGLLHRQLVGPYRPPAPFRPVEGARLVGADGPGPPLWFCPLYLQLLVTTRDEWQGHPGFAATCDALRRADALCRAAGAALVVLYAPSKGQALLPLLDHEKERLAAMVFHGAETAPPLTPDEYYARALRHKDDLEGALAEWCAAEGIPLLSATPPLRALAASGRAGYYSGDMHWNAEGQLAALEPLQEWLATHFPSP